MQIRDVIQAFRDWTSDKSSQLSQNNNFSHRLIWHYLLYYRAAALKDKINRRADISSETKQIIPCIPLMKADQSECPCAPLSGCKFVKSRVKLPRFIKIITVNSIDGQIAYEHVEWSELKDKLEHRLKAIRSMPYFTTKKIGNDEFLYLYNDNHKKFATMTIIPYDPSDVIKYADCKGKPDVCSSPMDADFCTDPELQRLIIEAAANFFLRSKAGAETDVFLNNMKDVPNLPLK